MQKHPSKGLLYLLGAIFLLLVLSALVEVPALSEAGQSEPPIVYHAELLPCTVPVAEDSIIVPPSPGYALGAMAIGAALMVLPARAGNLDANGRWVLQKRYVDSVYQVFRQEVAGG